MNMRLQIDRGNDHDKGMGSDGQDSDWKTYHRIRRYEGKAENPLPPLLSLLTGSIVIYAQEKERCFP